MVPSKDSLTRPDLLLTIDVEDWFQVENFKRYIPFTEWTYKDLRVEKNTHRLLNFFDEAQLKATFFTLGWLAERMPNLVQEIYSRGHEVASHGYNHILCSQQSTKDLKKDLLRSKRLLEDIIGSPVLGYRAPSFSISKKILKVVEECEYLYDSSFNSFNLNGRYGQLNISQNCKAGISLKISERLYELPISNIKFSNCVLPWGGGGYFRILPLPLFKLGVQHMLRKDNAYLFYLHPWEIDPDQPVVKKAARFLRFRHYLNLSKTLSRLSLLVHGLEQCHFVTCSQYIDNMNAMGVNQKARLQINGHSLS